VLKVCRIIFIQIRRGLQEKTYQKVAINLLHIQELKVRVFCFVNIFWVGKSIQQLDKDFFEIRALLFWINTFVLLE
jgi:hypothetical protein